VFQTILKCNTSFLRERKGITHTEKKNSWLWTKIKTASDNVGTTRWATFKSKCWQKMLRKKRKKCLTTCIYIQLTISLYTLKKIKWTNQKCTPEQLLSLFISSAQEIRSPVTCPCAVLTQVRQSGCGVGV